jgi:indolepyruvate ferredoxin oxidoreductase beta subunit
MERKDPINLIIGGVGGQGNILASELTSQAAFSQGFLVSVGETFGVTQRGGSVQSIIRLSRDRSYGPLIPKGQGDIIIGFEPLEVMRLLKSYGQEGVKVVMNQRPAYPVNVLQKKAHYPPVSQLIEWIESLAEEVRVLPATELAQKAGNSLATNVVMVGALAATGWLPLPKQAFVDALEEAMSGNKLALNQVAFELGYAAVSGQESGAVS